ncbi:MAG: hypothetical protein O7B30_00170 [Thaumarchaeota archaeon]|nr:hypothetical protein [Nitrososphaerota archaeon]
MPFEKSDGKPHPCSTATAVWIATALLHADNKNEEAFRQSQIFRKVKELQLMKVSDSTIRTHISSHCVANRKAQPDTHRKLFAVRNGWFRLYRPGDPYDMTRGRGRIAPLPRETPEKHRWFLNWYEDDYVKRRAPAPTKSESPNIPFAKIGEGGVIKVPEEVLSRLQLGNGDYIAFIQPPSGDVSIRKAKVRLEL